MHDLAVLRNLALIVGLAIPVVALAHRLRVPTLVGFLLVGVAIGPHGAAFIPEPDAVAALAEIGVVLLLFEIGLELSLSQVLGWGASILVAGGLQVLGVMGLAAAGGALLGLPPGQSLFYGALAALSSTAIVSKSLADRGELDAPHGREAIAVLLFQDLAIVPLMLVVPLFAAGAGGGGADPATGGAGGLWPRLGLGLAAMVALVAGGRLVVRWTLDRIVETRDRDLFTLCVGFFAMGTALAASTAGFSLAVGAFLAGLVISESKYGLQALDDVMPFRALFSGVFFTSIGMLLDLTLVAAHLPLLLGGTLLLAGVKAAVAAGAVMARGRRLDTALATGLSLAQIGEFSFVLAAAGLPLGLFGDGHYQVFLAVAALSMMVAPFLVAASRPWAVRLAGGRVPPRPRKGRPPPRETTPSSSATASPAATWRGCCRRRASSASSSTRTPSWWRRRGARGSRRSTATAPDTPCCRAPPAAGRGSSSLRSRPRSTSGGGWRRPAGRRRGRRSWCGRATSGPSTS